MPIKVSAEDRCATCGKALPLLTGSYLFVAHEGCALGRRKALWVRVFERFSHMFVVRG